MKKFVYSILALLMVACSNKNDSVIYISNNGVIGSGELIKKEIKLPQFNELELQLPATVNVTISSENSINVYAQKEILEIINLKVNNNKLTINSEKNYSTNKDIIIDIKTNNFNGLNLKGSGTINVLRLKNQDITVKLNGSGDVNIEGITNALIIDLNGSGTVQTNKLITKQAFVKLNGSGDIFINVENEIDAKLNGSGDITIQGNPKIKNTKINGSGNINFV